MQNNVLHFALLMVVLSASFGKGMEWKDLLDYEAYSLKVGSINSSVRQRDIVGALTLVTHAKPLVPTGCVCGWITNTKSKLRKRYC